LAFSYWIDNFGFITEGKLATIFIKPSLGVSNWPIIYIINYTPTKHHKFSGTIQHRAIRQPLGGVGDTKTKNCFAGWWKKNEQSFFDYSLRV
jgi:hypothetical protein